MALLPNQSFKQGMFSAGHFAPAISSSTGVGGTTGQQLAVNFFSGTMPSSMSAFWAMLSSYNASNDLRNCPNWVGTLCGPYGYCGLVRLNGSAFPTISSNPVAGFASSGALQSGVVRAQDSKVGGNISYALVMQASVSQATNSGCWCNGDGVGHTGPSSSFQNIANLYPALLLSVGVTGSNHALTVDTPNTILSGNGAACSVGAVKLYFSLV